MPQPDPGEVPLQQVEFGQGPGAVPAQPGAGLGQAQPGERLAARLPHRAELVQRAGIGVAGLGVAAGAVEDVAAHLVVVGERAGQVHGAADGLRLGQQGQRPVRLAADGQHVGHPAQRPGPATEVVGLGGYPGGLLEQLQGLAVFAGVAVHLGDAGHRPDHVPGLAVRPGLVQELLVQLGDRGVVALDAAGLGEAGEGVAVGQAVAAGLGQRHRVAEQPPGQRQGAALAGQGAAAPQCPGHGGRVAGGPGAAVGGPPGGARGVRPAQSPVGLGDGQLGSGPGERGVRVGECPVRRGQHLFVGGVHAQRRAQFALVLRGECLAVHQIHGLSIIRLPCSRTYERGRVRRIRPRMGCGVRLECYAWGCWSSSRRTGRSGFGGPGCADGAS
ncbi:putative DNA helicase [Streptomyces sp. 769]|nr:putative DNA helicase [Streptomyces sp. 769]